MVGEGSRDDSRTKKLARIFDTNHAYVSQARALVERDLLDGRNRLAACKLANVEPEYLTVNGDDPLALVVSLNVKRRNLTAGQKAVAAAEAWDMGSLKVGKGRAAALAELFGASKAYVEQARALLERDPPAAEAVKNGDLTLAEAHEALRKREGKTKGAAGEKRRLRESHPDLAEQVDAGWA
jgi:hypothetical protein